MSKTNLMLLDNLEKFTGEEAFIKIQQIWPTSVNKYCEVLAQRHFNNRNYISAAYLFKKSIIDIPRNYQTYCNLALALNLSGNHAESVDYAREAFLLKPNDIKITKIYLECLLMVGRVDEIEAICNELNLDCSNDIDIDFILAQSYRLQGNFSASISLLNRLNNQSNLSRFEFAIADVIGETDTSEAVARYEDIISRNTFSLSSLNKYNLSLHYLRTRCFEKGWQLFEYGLDKDIGDFGRRIPYNFTNTYRADLSPVNSDNWIMICSEQGIGDQLTFLSALPEALREFPKIFFVCEKRMIPILSRSYPSLKLTSNGLVDGNNLLTNHKNGSLGYIPLGSLLARYRPNLDSFLVNRKPFLNVESSLYYHFKNILNSHANGRKVIGISWKSKVAKNLQKIKNIEFLDWLPIFDANTLIVNLQYGDTLEEQALVKSLGLEMLSFNDIDFTSDLDQWMSIAATCDGVVSISSSLVHFAGACGQHVRVVMPFSQGHWSLGLNESDSIFYPNVHIERKLFDDLPFSSLILNAADKIVKV